ncbi:MAG TPA: hypothetical protein DEA27_01435 [Candidatus Moranbacteria bacterium]|nr:hypothetical protein [Candidatus Moranbacteria bacterium]
MFFSVRKNRDKKEFEYEKIRTLSKKKEKFAFFRAFYIFFYYLLSVSFLGVFFYVLFFSPFLAVEQIEISGIQELNLENVSKVSESVYEGKYLGFIPRNNFLFITQRSVENVLKNDFKKIRNVTVTKKFPDSVNINIDERKALMVWCGKEKCYLMDESGTPYSEADFNSPEFAQNHLLKINDFSGREIVIGEKIVDSVYEKYVLDAKDALGKTGFEANGEYSTPSRMAEEIRIKTIQGPELYFSTQFPLETALNALIAVIKKEITHEKQGEIEYIDLRNEGKVFYKFKNLEPETEGNENGETEGGEKEQN